jgi:hypothetical protein
MKCDHLFDYLQVREVARRWRLDADSTDIHWAIMKGVLKPCIWVTGQLEEVQIERDGASVMHVNGIKLIRAVNGWCEPCAATQVGAYEMLYPFVRDLTSDEPCYVALQNPLSLSDVIKQGVVMINNLVEAEAILKIQQDDELHGKERLTLYRLLVTAVFEQYGWWDSDGGRSEAIPKLVKAAEAIGLSVSYNAAKEHLRRAWARCPPEIA